MAGKSKKKGILQVSLDHLSDDELEEVAGGVMGSLPRVLGKGCACVCHGDDAEKTAAGITSGNHLAK